MDSYICVINRRSESSIIVVRFTYEGVQESDRNVFITIKSKYDIVIILFEFFFYTTQESIAYCISFLNFQFSSMGTFFFHIELEAEQSIWKAWKLISNFC